MAKIGPGIWGACVMSKYDRKFSKKCPTTVIFWHKTRTPWQFTHLSFIAQTGRGGGGIGFEELIKSNVGDIVKLILINFI